jgi:hypothetical protein
LRKRRRRCKYLYINPEEVKVTRDFIVVRVTVDWDWDNVDEVDTDKGSCLDDKDSEFLLELGSPKHNSYTPSEKIQLKKKKNWDCSK